MTDFDCSIPTKVFFGKNKIEKIPKEIKKYSSRILFVYGQGSIKRNGIYQKIVNLLTDSGIEYKELSGIKPNPRIVSVRQGVALCRVHSLDFILAVGGGSVIDCAKAVAAGVYYENDPWDFFTKKGDIYKALPIGTVLTLSATGSEMNGFAVISNEQTKEKLPAGSDILRPLFSVLDPTYTFSVSKEQTAAGVVDIYSHILEQYFSKEDDTYLQDRLSEGLMKTCIHYAPIVINEPDNYQARAQLMWASSLALNGILSYGKTGDWSTHYIEHSISAVTDLTHGIGLALLIPYWLEYVMDDKRLVKYVNYAENVFNIKEGSADKKARAAIDKTREFFSSLSMPSRLREVGVNENDLGAMADKTTRFGPVGAFLELDTNDVYQILKSAY
ncbi:MAG: iron-containing alcohol dehydrogenase [Candidatus Omnitrophica bacterium]|nr:iron-containing alcohol dehydrogenase [Candidatus Omnitrophota bacterium]